MTATITPFLMFQDGRCEEAFEFYASLFEDGRLIEIKRYGPGEAGPEGTVLQAKLQLNGQTVIGFDSPVRHAFAFTPSISLFVNCDNEAQLDTLFARLSDGGGVMMGLADYGFSQKFGWTADRFGVSWQLNLPHPA